MRTTVPKELMYIQSKLPAGKPIINKLIDIRTETMGTDNGSQELFQGWLINGPGVYAVDLLTELQCDNMIRYTKKHEPEQIVQHIMDLECK